MSSFPPPSGGTLSRDDAWTTPPSPAPPSGPPPSHQERPRSRQVVAWFLAALLGAGVGSVGTFVALGGGGRSPAGGAVRVASPVNSGGDEGRSAVAAVAKAVLPSIVRVDVGDRFGSGGLGSGVIYREDGFIVTNAHVVDGADQVRVHLNSGEELSARVVGTGAPTVDLAVLRVDRKGLPAATFGASRTLELGEPAVVIGSPFGLDTTVTSGVISGLHRNLNLGDGIRFTDGIQTDAPLNPGNSGGALANSRGEIVGINTATVGAGGGVGFAIPIEIVRKVADQIIQTGNAQLAFIGIAGDNLANGRGARIREVVSGGPADDAGLRPDDVVVEFDGKKVESMDDLVSMLIDKNVNDAVKITYERDGKRQDASVKLAARPGR